ncbi:MAG: glycoside hydrolase family 2 TIM barrel-domain containing protein, partial [Myxococcota bacterium]
MAAPAAAQTNKVEVYKDDTGFKLKVDGKDLMVLGMNWTYVPIGENYNYSLWTKSDDYIREALDREMRLFTQMGGNALRIYVGIPKKWIQYLYEKHGVYTILNHPLARYGMSIDGVWTFPTNYQDPRTRELVRAEVAELVKEYKDTPGLLMWLLGNENNYGLVWKTTEIEDLPVEEANSARAEHLYSLFGEVIRDIKKLDPNHPVSMANGDLGYIDLIVKHCQGLDIMGSNVYRGASSGDLFQVVKDKLDLPFLYTEFGSDAYNAKEKREDSEAQAEYVRALWQEIYEQSHGKGRVGNAIGGLTFQWSDGWWKYRQEINLDVQDTNASWANGGYEFDHVEGENNMNEEWFGVCAKGPTDSEGFFDLYPRPAYYVLQHGYKQDPYAPTTTLATIREHWAIDPSTLSASYDARVAKEKLRELELLRIENLRMEFRYYATDGNGLDDDERESRRFE